MVFTFLTRPTFAFIMAFMLNAANLWNAAVGRARARSALWLLALGAIGVALALLPLPLAAGLVGGALATVSTLIYPLMGLGFLLLSIPFGAVVNTQIGGFNFGPNELIFALMMLGWYARLMTRPTEAVVATSFSVPSSPSFAFPTIVWPLALFLLVCIASVTSAQAVSVSIKELIKWLEVLFIILFVAHWVQREQIPTLLTLIFVITAAQAAVGLYQTAMSLGPDNFRVPLGGRLVMRAYGTFEQPNPFAAYLNYTLPIILSLLIGFFVERASWGEKAGSQADEGDERDRDAGMTASSAPLISVSRNLLLLAALLALPIIAAALFFSLSRGAWLGLALGCGVMLALRSQRALFGFVLLGFSAAALSLLGSLNVLPASVAERIADVPKFLGLDLFDPRGVPVTSENFAIVDRMAHWFAAWQMFQDYPWLGVGIGNYSNVYYAYNLKEWPFSLGHAHNFYLNMLAEVGLIGAIAYFFFVISTVSYGWYVARRSEGIWRALAFGILGTLVVIAVHNFFDNLYVHGMNIQFGVLLGLLARQAKG